MNPVTPLPSVSVVIPTYGREGVLLDTVRSVLALAEPPDEVLVIDQTEEHESDTAAALHAWASEGVVRWIRLPRPSIPVAMNTGLREARSQVVLFLDDDVVPEPGLVAVHRGAHGGPSVAAVVGMVLQPGEEPVPGSGRRGATQGLGADLGFRFCSSEPCEIANVMAGNLSVNRDAALACGGFDERFVGVAYRFETEFARRLKRHGGRIVYEPRAAIRHLKAPSGGTRTWGDHRTSARPEHSVGDYYFALLEGRGLERWRYVLRRIVREPLAGARATGPASLPAKLLGELRGLQLARKLVREYRGPS